MNILQNSVGEEQQKGGDQSPWLTAIIWTIKYLTNTFYYISDFLAVVTEPSIML